MPVAFGVMENRNLLAYILVHGPVEEALNELRRRLEMVTSKPSARILIKKLRKAIDEVEATDADLARQTKASKMASERCQKIKTKILETIQNRSHAKGLQ